jgi:hypothetical protein
MTLLAVAGIVHCQSARAAETLEINVDRDGPLMLVRATLASDASAALCYEVLADFDHIEDFAPGMHASDVISAPGQPIRLRQIGDASAGPFKFEIDVTLAVTESPPTHIGFQRVAGNLRQMTGGWDVSGDGSHCDIAYRADIEPQFWVPPLIGPRLMRNQVETQMRGVLAEIRRRAGHVPAASTSPR